MENGPIAESKPRINIKRDLLLFAIPSSVLFIKVKDIKKRFHAKAQRMRKEGIISFRPCAFFATLRKIYK
jgi:hypothetical protein